MCYFATAIFTCNHSFLDLQPDFNCDQPCPISTYVYSTKVIAKTHQCPYCNPNPNLTNHFPNPRNLKTAPLYPKHGPHSGAPCVQPQGDSGRQMPRLGETYRLDRGTLALPYSADGLPSGVPYVQPRGNPGRDQHQMARLGEAYGLDRGTQALLNLGDGPRSGKEYVQPRGDSGRDQRR